MLSLDILGYILRCYVASQAIIDELVWMKLVSKQWQIVVDVMFLDQTWLCPFIQSGNSFVDDIAAHAAIIFDWDDLKIDQASLHDYLQKMRMHTRHEAAQFHGIEKIQEMISQHHSSIFKVTPPDMLLLFNIVNNAMNTHREVVRVQKIGLRLQYTLLSQDQYNNTPVCHEYFRAVDGLVRNMQFFGDDVNEKDFMHMCNLIIFEFSTDFVPRMLSCGVEKILFARMLKYTDEMNVQTLCMSALAFFYDESSPSLDPSDVWHFLTALFDGMDKFMHYEQFLHNVANLFKTLVFIEEYSSTICYHVVEKGYMNIFADELNLLLSYGDNVDEMQQAEVVYTSIMKTFRGILNHQPLCIDMVLENIKDVIQVGMARYETNIEVQFTTCVFFRFVFFPFSETRGVAPTLKIVQLVLNAMKNNPAEHLLNVECVLTLDTLMNSRHITKYVNEQHGFKCIAHKLYDIVGFESTSSAKNCMSTKFSLNCQRLFVEASFSILNKLPPRSRQLEYHVTNCTVVLASVVTEVMRQHSQETEIQSAALHALEKYIVAHPELHSRFREDGGLLLMQNALKLPDLRPESQEIAQKILRLCASHLD